MFHSAIFWLTTSAIFRAVSSLATVAVSPPEGVSLVVQPPSANAATTTATASIRRTTTTLLTGLAGHRWSR